MKKFLSLSIMLAASLQVGAQCEAPTSLPYLENSETVVVPFIPECTTSSFNTFSSSEIFETTSGPIPGFEGNVIAYNTFVNSEFGMPPWSMVAADLTLPQMQLQQGVAYTISFRYGNSNPDLQIDQLVVNLGGTAVTIATINNITGATPTQFTSQPFSPPTTGTYTISLNVQTEGTQGFLYIDDIVVQQSGLMAVQHNNFSRINIYPNPVNDVLHVNNEYFLNKIEIYNMAGQKVHTSHPHATYATIDASKLADGVYIVSLYSEEASHNVRIVKQ